MPEFIREAARFVEMCEKPFDLQDMRKNSRGEHWFSICGHDRNNKVVGVFDIIYESESDRKVLVPSLVRISPE